MDMFCVSCGREFGQSDEFCGSCGAARPVASVETKSLAADSERIVFTQEQTGGFQVCSFVRGSPDGTLRAESEVFADHTNAWVACREIAATHKWISKPNYKDLVSASLEPTRYLGCVPQRTPQFFMAFYESSHADYFLTLWVDVNNDTFGVLAGGLDLRDVRAVADLLAWHPDYSLASVRRVDVIPDVRRALEAGAYLNTSPVRVPPQRGLFGRKGR